MPRVHPGRAAGLLPPPPHKPTKTEILKNTDFVDMI
jgi:hypothetical protein